MLGSRALHVLLIRTVAPVFDQKGRESQSLIWKVFAGPQCLSATHAKIHYVTSRKRARGVKGGGVKHAPPKLCLRKRARYVCEMNPFWDRGVIPHVVQETTQIRFRQW